MKTLLAALLLLSTAASAHTEAWQRKYLLASRNSGGTYSLPNAPVVTGTTITSSWANTTLADLATELTNSLDRSGRGAMTGPLRLNNAINAAIPDIAWGAETNSGFYRAAAGDFRFALGGVDIVKWSATVQEFTGKVKLATSGIPVVFDSSIFGTLTGIWFGAAAADGTRAIGNYSFLSGDGLGTYMNVATGQTGHLRVNNIDVFQWTGTAITASQPLTVAGETVNTGITNNGSGFKHKRGTFGCSTVATVNSLCTTTVTWTSAFADANYTVVCTGDAAIVGKPVIQGVLNVLAASVDVVTENTTAGVGQFNAIDCIAVHD